MSDAQRPNLLLVIVDQWRADCLGVEGHPVAQTPHLDTLAHTGTRFSHAYTACPSCVPARAALMTGLSGARNGFVGYRDGVTWQYPTTLAGTLSGAGYQTQCVGKMHVYPWRNLLGYHHVLLHDGYMHKMRHDHREFGAVDDYLPWLRERVGRNYADHNDTGVGCNGYVVAPWCYDDLLHPSAWVTTHGIDFLRRRDPTKPFFLTLSYHRPHPPLDPPARYLERYRDAELPPLLRGDWVDHELPTHRGPDSPVPLDAASIDLARRAYYAQLTFIDHQLNRVLMALYEHGELNETAILFVADHGEMLYDHNHVAKGVPFEGSARVPWLLRLPQSRRAEAQRKVVDEVVELRDILPTCCDLAGIPAPPDLDGRSVVPLLRGHTDGWRDALQGEHFLAGDSNFWLTDGHEKYIWFSQTGRELLFDLETDPNECHDLSATQPARLAAWRQRLVTELSDRPEGFVDGQALVVGRPQQATLDHAGRGPG